MKLSHQGGWIGMPNLTGLFIFAAIGLIATIGGAVWLARYLLQHLNWI